MYRIIIADDEPLIIRGLKKMMEWGKMDTEVVGEAEDGEQLLNLLDTLEPDIMSLPGTQKPWEKSYSVRLTPSQ